MFSPDTWGYKEVRTRDHIVRPLRRIETNAQIGLWGTGISLGNRKVTQSQIMTHSN